MDTKVTKHDAIEQHQLGPWIVGLGSLSIMTCGFKFTKHDATLLILFLAAGQLKRGLTLGLEGHLAGPTALVTSYLARVHI